MTLKSQVVIEITKDNHTFQFVMPTGVSYGTAYNAAFEVLQNILEMSKQSLEQAKPMEDRQGDTNG